ncbi:L-serine ammonia-lyase, iron-sulfur-dependent, subunit alpha, partial [Enterococcus cecorum]|nr:L-serine ammonia-lyase, iron-sulfur-dependent, subunit alpha [Enterococcus cecorum]
MFYSIEDIIQQSKNYKSVAELMIATEIELTGRSREQIIALMKKNLEVMKHSVQQGIDGVTSVTGLTGKDAT